MRTRSFFAALIATMIVTPAASANPLKVETISVKASTGIEKSVEVAIKTDGIPDFTVFRLTNPARVVVDIPDADLSGVNAPTLEPDQLVSSITTTAFRGRAGEVGRVVMVFREDITYRADVRGQAVVLVAERATAEGKAPAPVSPTASAAVEETPVVVLNGDQAERKVASRLVGIEHKRQAKGSLLSLRTDGEVVKYEISEVDNPPRLVIDLHGLKANKGLGKTLDDPALVAARVGRHDGRVRVVLDGRTEGALPAYDVAATDEGLKILFDGELRAAAEERAEVRAVRLEEKQGFVRLVFDAEGEVSVRTVGNAPRVKTVALDGVNIAPRLLGEQQFNKGGVKGLNITPAERAGSYHLALHVDRDVEHSVWQKGGKLYWDVRGQRSDTTVASSDRVQPRAAGYETELALAAHEGASAQRYRGRKITIDLQDADIVNVIRLLGDVSGKNVVVGEEVKGKVTIKLRNVPWDQALDVILRTKQLGMETRRGIVRIAPQAQLDAERAARLKAQAEAAEKEPTTVRLIPVNYAVAKDLVPQVKELLSARGRVTFDERTNVIIVEDVRDNLNQSEQLVRTLDTQTPLVLIESRMVEASTTFSRTLGIQWGGGLYFSQRGGNPTGLIFPNNVGIVGGAENPQLMNQATPGVPQPSNYAVNLPAEAVTSSIGMNLGAIGNYGFLNARLSAAESNGEAKIISAPKVTTLNNKAATISQGVQIPIDVTTQNVVQTTVLEANLELKVTPHVTADGSILMELEITNNTPVFEGAAAGSINTKQVETEMMVKDGDTAVIGGIYTRFVEDNYDQTPFLGSIPVLGWLFKSYKTTDNRNEMLVFLTPRIINRAESGF